MNTTVTSLATTRAERMRQPIALDVAKAAAEKHGVCVRPFAMEVTDPTTGHRQHIGVPCGSTVESVCTPCAKKARALRQQQCREGWHLGEEPDFTPATPTAEQRELLTTRADLVTAYRTATEHAEHDQADELRAAITDVDSELRAFGVRGRLPSPDLPGAVVVKRSTKRRQDAPTLPRRRVAKTTVGREYAGKFRPSMFVTLTLDTYGRVRDDGTPVNTSTYDYRRSARDAVHFSALVDRWWQNLRRVIGWDAQYFATVEPQRRATPHLHAAIRGSIPHEVIRQVTAATYHQVWWPQHNQPVYGERLPVWDRDARSFVDPDTRQPLTTWEAAVDELEQPAHVVSFGEQVHSKGILGGTDEAGRHIGYLTKYLTKSTGEVVESTSTRQADHHDRLHAELSVTPCSERCPVWLVYGIQPKNPHARMTPGHCKGRAHRRSTLGLPGRRVLVSRKWSGKTLADHKADRKAFVVQALAAVGVKKPEPDRSHLVWRKLTPGDRSAPPRAHLLLHAISERIRWRAEYDAVMLAATGDPPGTAETSATRTAA